MFRDYLKLHFIVFLASFTAIIGHEISLDAIPLVFWRTLMAAVALAVLIRIYPPPGVPPSPRARLLMIGNGLLIGIHWILFFLAVKISNVSVCLVGMATSALWTAMLEPVIFRRRPPSIYEFVLGVVIVGAVALVFQPGFKYAAGLFVAIASAIAAVIFSLANGVFIRTTHHWVIARDGMIGSTLLCAVALPFTDRIAGGSETFLPGAVDLAWLLVLSLVCTVYAFSAYVELLKRLRVFAVSVAFNLEPVYGIALAALLYREHEQLGGSFYLGTAVLLAAVFTYPFLKRGKGVLLNEGGPFLPGAPPLKRGGE
ncbi:DMT family transporter [soil metagenome]